MTPTLVVEAGVSTKKYKHSCSKLRDRASSVMRHQDNRWCMCSYCCVWTTSKKVLQSWQQHSSLLCTCAVQSVFVVSVPSHQLLVRPVWMITSAHLRCRKGQTITVLVSLHPPCSSTTCCTAHDTSSSMSSKELLGCEALHKVAASRRNITRDSDTPLLLVWAS